MFTTIAAIMFFAAVIGSGLLLTANNGMNGRF
jgi:hypothetical protein